MDGLLPIDVLFRWVHVGTAVVLIGGSVFMRFVLMPAAKDLPDDEHQALRGRVLGTWKRFVGLGIVLFLVSGFYNYVRAVPHHKGDGLYHALLGTKMILAFVIFFLASALVGRSPKLEPIRQNSQKWLGVLVLLAATVIGISGFVKVARKPTTAGNTADQSQPEGAAGDSNSGD